MAGPWERYGPVEQGNVDLAKRPVVRNADGTISTVRSISANIDGKEVLLPTVSDDGRILSDDQAITLYRQTGKHLGKFNSPEAATAYAMRLHEDQAQRYGAKGPWSQYGSDGVGLSAAAQQIEGDAITQGAKNFAKDMPLGDQVLAGVGKAMVDTGRGIRGLYAEVADRVAPEKQSLTSLILGKAPDRRQAIAQEVQESRATDAPLMDTTGGQIGNIGSQIVTALVPGGSVAAAGKLASLAGAARAGNVLSNVGRAAMTPTTLRGAATIGAATGAVQPAVDLGERAGNAAFGAGGAAVGHAALQGLARIVRPKTDPNALALMKEGITPTPGQLLGGGFKRLEEGLTSVPMVGQSIRNAQTRGIEDFNRAAINRALEPIGETLPKGLTGREAIEHAGEALGKRYETLLPKLTTQADGQFISEIQSLRNMMGSGSIDPAKAAQFESILNNQVLAKFQPGANGAPTLTGQTMKDIESDLGTLASRFRRSMDPDQQSLGDALLEVQDALRSNVQRSNPQFASELKSINKGYANFKRVQKAAASVNAEDGVFTASQLQSAVKALDRSKDKAAFARGDALMQDLTDPGKSVLAPKVPDSGTPFRVASMLGAGGVATGGAAGLLSPGVLGAAAAAPVMYSRAGQNALAALLARRPDSARPIANALQRLAPYAPLPALAASNQQRQ